MKFVYSDSNDEGKFKSIPDDNIGISTDGENTIFTFSNIASTNDPIIKGLHLIPKANLYFRWHRYNRKMFFQIQ